MNRTRISMALLAAAALGLTLASCNDNELGLEKRRPNRPPQTILSSGPPDSSTGTNYRVHLFWSGSDPDGTIDHFDFIMIDHPASDDNINPGDSTAADRVVVRVPKPDDPRWTATAANDTLIVTRADTLRHNPPANPGQNEFVRRQNFERWHSFFVRAVDNEGLADQTPEYRSFNSQTIAPTVFLKAPVSALLEQFSGPKVIVFNWDGLDEVGDGNTLAPIASRWTIFQTRKTTEEGYVGYPDTLYKLPPSAWQPWRRWDARDKTGKQAIVKNLIPAEQGGGFYLFAVQAMDEAGAVTPVFDATSPGKNNVARVFVNDQVGATLNVSEKFLGQFSFVGDSNPVVLAVAAGQPISFKWRGDASGYGGDIVAYRYGWNIRNPSNDEEWEQNWCETCRAAPTRVFNSGTQRFFLETRDNAETITHAEFELVVYQVTRSRDFLFVDDTTFSPGSPDENSEDRRWTTVIDSLVARRPFQLDLARDIYDVEASRRLPPDLPLVFDYKTIVWTARGGNAENALRTLAFFFDPFVSTNQNAAAKFNYLNIYIENGGEFWLSGDGVTDLLWPISRESDPLGQFPANITNWDDPIQSHPEVDSVGVDGFLWKLGVEAVDLGAGGRAPIPRNDRLDQACLGFRRAMPDSSERQLFTSSVDADHQHTLRLPTADVNQPPVANVTYTTQPEAGHTHTITLTPEQLRSLARGERFTVQTSESSTPTPHHHTFELVDQVGLWGAPAILERDDATWPLPAANVNPAHGRYNVEIYNMASFMAQQQPPLNPPVNRWVSLYEYVSVTRADPNANPAVIYPATADGQPAIILRKALLTDRYYSRALCGFEPWRLKFQSHLALADFILLRHFRLGIPDS